MAEQNIVNEKVKTTLKVAGWSFALEMCILTPMRGGYIGWEGVAGAPITNASSLLLFALLSWMLFVWKGDKLNPIALICSQFFGATAIPLIIHILHWQSTLYSFIEIPIVLIGILIGFGMWKANLYLKPILIGVTFFGALYVVGPGTSEWLALIL